MIRMKIKDICDLQNGRAFKPSDWGTAGLPIIRIQNLNDERAPFNYYGGKYNLAQEVDNGDLLFSWSGTPGTSFGAFLWNRGKGVLNQHIFKVIPKVEVDKTYLMYALNGNISTIISKAHGGVGLQHITKKELDEIEIQMVSISRQKKIVEILEKISLLIFLRKQQLSKFDELVKARFVEMFGDCKTNPKNWKTKALEKIANVGSSKRVFVEELQDSGIPFYRGTEIGALAEKKAVIPALFITEEHYKQLCETTGKPQKGDLLMPSICPDGRIWIVDTDEPFYFKDGRVLWVHLTSANYNSVFLLYTLKDRIMTDYASIASGTTFAELKIFALKKCKIFDVPLELQNQFANFVERVDQQKQTVQQSLEKLELMKKALMQEYFG